MKLSIVAGATSQSVNIFIQDSSKTDGSGLSGLVYNTSGLTAYYSFSGANATATAITLATLATVTTAYSSGGFIELDSTHMKGVYRFDLPNAVLATSKGRSVVVYLYGATNMAPCVLEIELVAWDNQDAVRAGLSALPNASAGASGGLLINGSNTGSITFTGKLTITDGVAVSCSTNNRPAMSLIGSGSGAGFSAAGGTTGSGITATGGSSSGYGISATGLGALSSGIRAVGGDASGGTAAGSGIEASGGAASTSSGGTAGAGISGTGGNGKSSTNGAGHGLNLIGGSVTTVSGGSGLKIAATGSVPGLSLDTLTASGAVTFSGAVTLSSTLDVTGAFTASNASNNIAGIDVAKISGSSAAATNAKNGWAGLIADTGTAQDGASTTITLRSGAVATDDYYIDAVVAITGGTGVGQARKISGYVGSTKVATVDADWATNPDSTSTYQILGRIV